MTRVALIGSILCMWPFAVQAVQGFDRMRPHSEESDKNLWERHVHLPKKKPQRIFILENQKKIY